MPPPTPSVSVSVPANLLLMGEYAVLEEGGLGLAIAPDIRVRGTAGTPARRRSAGRGRGISVVGRLPGATVEWHGADSAHHTNSGRQDTGLLGPAAAHLSDRYPAMGTDARIDLESTAFFAVGGRKRGLGSSAAIVVALTALWLRMTGNLPNDPADARELVFRTALDAHRAGQGGEGSGYDVACSTFGGMILFNGGRQPSARRITLPWFPELRLIQGSAPVRTVGAVGKYRAWKAGSPKDALSYLDKSNRLVTAFAEASGWEAAATILRDYRDLAVDLGATIGVPSALDPPAWIRGNDAVVKAVGAGSELGVVLAGRSSPEGAGSYPGTPITVSNEGVMWT